MSLTEPLVRFVMDQVASGRYRTASEFVRACIRARMATEAEWNARLDAIRGSTRRELEQNRREHRTVRDDRTGHVSAVSAVSEASEVSEVSDVSEVGARRGARRNARGGSDPLDVVLRHRDEILRIVEHYGARRARIFGPVVRGEAKSPLELRLLVELGPEGLGFETTGIRWDVGDLLRGTIDVVAEGDLDPDELRRIEAEAMEL